MESIKIRNFYSSRIIEKIQKVRSFISKITYNSSIYNKLEFDETPQNLEFFPPNFWRGDIENGNLFLKKGNFNPKKIKDDFFFIIIHLAG